MTSKTPTSKEFSVSILALIILLSLTLFGLYKEYQPQNKSATEITKSGAVNQGELVKTIIQPNAYMYTKVFLDRDQTSFSLPYKFEGEPQLLWLFMATTEDVPTISRLIHHPTLANLEWETVSNDLFTLYQKDKQYSSVESFLKNTPTGVTILADEFVNFHPDYQHIGATVLNFEDPNIDFDNTDYILTTFKPELTATNDQGISFYQVIIDASSGLINEKNELVWRLFAPQATEEFPLYIGSIHVNYL